MARELLVAIDIAPRQQPVARDEPRKQRDTAEDRKPEHGPVRSRPAVDSRRPQRGMRPPAGKPEHEEERDDEEPEEEARAQAAERGQQRDAPAPEQREEVDRCD